MTIIGPVRSVHFHNSQPFFVSGGDDCKIKVWNYNTKKCQFNLTGHTDYIRTVQFHHELPWILSASDDQTIRIWNWLNRTLLTTATGHDHYVMSAFFHPSQDLIVSASLDQTIRMWDYSVLRKKFFEARSNSLDVIAFDVTVKFKLEGHDRGVNWAVFHPTLNLIASGSDDKTIKIWKFTDSKWNDADTLRGHHNNVSSVAFHPKLDYLISNSEDKSFRIWDLNKKTSIEKITKEHDRFWVLATHPTLNIFASGSDSGITVFKLEDTRIPAISFQNQILLYCHKTVRQWKTGETEKKTIIETKNHSKGVKTDIRSIILNPFVNPNQILNYALPVEDSSNPRILFYYLKSDPSSGKYVSVSSSSEQVIESASSGCFLSNNKFLTLTSNGALIGFDTNNLSNKFAIELPTLSKEKFEAIYQAPLGKIILKFKNGIVGMLDANTKKMIQETNEMTDMKFVVWNQTLTIGALVGSNSIFIINKNLEILSKIKENSQIKSASFDENNVLFYTTHFHIKYALQENLGGIIVSLETPVYLMMVNNSTFYISDSLQEMKTQPFNYTEVRFKLSLLNKNYEDVVNILRSGAIYGLKAIENIQNAGFPDLSLKFVNDPKQKFNLALQSGKLEEAVAAAEVLNNKYYYNKLADKAMMMGKLSVRHILNLIFIDCGNLSFKVKIFRQTGIFLCFEWENG
jgi:coatomer protein complex subunit alpha (xenin)